MGIHLKTLLTLSAAAILVSCAVGPNFKTPLAPDVKRYTETDLPAKTAAAETPEGAAQTFVDDADIPEHWWTLFGSDPLNTLMNQALKSNPDLKAATASLTQAQENFYAARGGLLPSVDAGFDPTRQKFNPAAFGEQGAPSSIFTLYNASVSVSYGLDIFGGTRRAIEAAHAQASTQRYELEAAYLSLTANVVTAAIQDASLREQIKETQNIVDIESKQLEVLKKQFALGGIPKAIVLSQEAALAQTQTALPPLEKQLAQTRNQIAVLAGQFPGNAPAETFALTSLHLPESLPLALPSKLTQRRPDIKAAEAQLHVASAEIGVATAAMFPQLTLSASYGSETTSFSQLFTSGAEVWSIGGGILQPLFHGGTLLHEKRAAQAAYDKAQAQYESTVLLAFKNVADTLRALQYDAEGLKAQANADSAAKNSLDLAQAQFAAGAISYPQLLDAQRTYAQARIGLVQASALRLVDTAALFQALGGGWSVEKMAQKLSDAKTEKTTVASAAPETQPSAKSEKKP